MSQSSSDGRESFAHKRQGEQLLEGANSGRTLRSCDRACGTCPFKK